MGTTTAEEIAVALLEHHGWRRKEIERVRVGETPVWIRVLGEAEAVADLIERKSREVEDRWTG